MPIIWFFIGPPGCGKGTQRKKFDIPGQEMSHFLREIIKKGGEVGRLVELAIKQRRLADDSVVIQAVVNEMEDNSRDEFILDGFPRTLGQAKAAMALIDRGYDVRFMIFDLDDDSSLKRLMGRYERDVKENEERIAQGLEPLELRADDGDPDKNCERLSIHHLNHPEIEAYLRENAVGRTYYIDASGDSPGSVTAQILEKVPELVGKIKKVD